MAHADTNDFDRDDEFLAERDPDAADRELIGELDDLDDFDRLEMVLDAMDELAEPDQQGADDHAPIRLGEDRAERDAHPMGGSVVDRRLGLERRDDAEGTQNRRSTDIKGPAKKVDLNRRRGPGRRLSDYTKAAEEGEMTEEQFLFLKSIEGFKRANNKSFPTWTDVLEIVRLLGYRKTMPIELDLENVTDWREPANAPSNVRPVRPEDREDGKRRKAA